MQHKHCEYDSHKADRIYFDNAFDVHQSYGFDSGRVFNDVSLHHVTDIKRKTKTIPDGPEGDFKVTYLIITQADGTETEITLFLEDK